MSETTSTAASMTTGGRAGGAWPDAADAARAAAHRAARDRVFTLEPPRVDRTGASPGTPPPQGTRLRPASGTRTDTATKRRVAASSARLRTGFATPSVKVDEAARSADLAACGTREAGAPRAVPRARATRGSEIFHSTDAANREPAAGRRTVDRASSAWSRAGTLSAAISITEARPKTVSAAFDARKPKDGPSSMTPRRASAPPTRSGSHALSPVQAASEIASATDEAMAAQL